MDREFRSTTPLCPSIHLEFVNVVHYTTFTYPIDIYVLPVIQFEP